MITIIKTFLESIRQAWQQLVANKLRTFLSLLGISIGIFCIIGVQTAVDSLEADVRGSMEKLGDDVLYVQKFDWSDVGEKWWEYLRRPNVDFDDYEQIRDKVETAEVVTYQVGLGTRSAKWRNNTVERAYFFAVSDSYDRMYDLEFGSGRFFSPVEYRYGAPIVVLGATVAEELFGDVAPVGKTIKIRGKKMEVVGVLAPAGDDLVNPLDFDELIMVGYEYARKVANLDFGNRWADSSVNVKAKADVPLERLKNDVIGALRAERRLRPKEKNNFSLNELSIVSNALGSFFGVLNMIGWFIGGFAILVGGFSVANIMFVSVKERTGIIGIKKAIGAKPAVILVEFLIESIVLCVIGGLMGLALIAILVAALQDVMPFVLVLSPSNILFGLGISIFIGIVAGAIPAVRAANMDPVVAIRS